MPVSSVHPVLLTGSTGQLGSALLPLLRETRQVVAPARCELDLTSPDAIRRLVRELRPGWIIHPAAYTAVDRAESEPALAYAINEDAVRVLGEEAHALDIPVIHFSTDYVFSGEGDEPWREADPTGPLSAYGSSKLAGERALAASGAAHLTLRTSWVYGATGQNFLRTMLRLGRERPVLRVVDDQHGTPTASGDLAALTVFLVEELERRSAAEGVHLADSVRASGGVLHAAGAGIPTTWCGFARSIFASASAHDPGTSFAQVEAIPTSAYPTPARRPLNSRLCCDLLVARFAYRMPDWRASLSRVMAEMTAQTSGMRSNEGIGAATGSAG